MITFSIFLATTIITYIGFKTPWTIPIIIVLAGIITNFSGKRIPNDGPPPKKVQWSSLFIFIFLFIGAGFLSEQGTRQNWEYRKAFNLFENNYRFGSLVFGGGDYKQIAPINYEGNVKYLDECINIIFPNQILFKEIKRVQDDKEKETIKGIYKYIFETNNDKINIVELC